MPFCKVSTRVSGRNTGLSDSAAAMASVMKGAALDQHASHRGNATVEKAIEAGIMFAGTPDQVYNQIKKMYDYVGGFGHVLNMGQAGFLEHDDTVHGIRMFAREVYPRLKAQIEKRFPDYADLVDPKPASIAQVQSALRAGETLISIYLGEDAAFVWAVPKTGAAAFATRSMGAPPLNNTPFRAAEASAATTVTGVEMTRAHGQASTRKIRPR